MGRPKKDSTVPANTNTGMIPWEQELAASAVEATAMQPAASGNFFSLKSGILTWQGAAYPNNEMAVIVAAAALENVYYEGTYDPNSPANPKCFALGVAEADMAPHEICVTAGTNQAEACAGCPHNQWGSAIRDGQPSRGKACRNTQRLALISAGAIDGQGRFEADAPETLNDAELGYMRLPVTSIKAWAGYVRQLAATSKRPPFAVFTKIKVVPDMKNQFAVQFSSISLVGPEYREIVTRRAKEAAELIQFPYAAWTEPTPQQPVRGRLPMPQARQAVAQRPALPPRAVVTPTVAARPGRPPKASKY